MKKLPGLFRLLLASSPRLDRRASVGRGSGGCRQLVLAPCAMWMLLVIHVAVSAAELPPERQVDLQAPMLESKLDRPLRYFPAKRAEKIPTTQIPRSAPLTAFVITNGGEFFNRPLYGGNTAFRVDAGDVPEFSLYLPGRGGNLRLGIKRGSAAKWLHQSTEVVAKYQAGSMSYEVRDGLLGTGVLELDALAGRDAETLLVKVSGRDIPADVEILCAFGGASGERGRRGGDIGCESQPVGEMFQLRPDQCVGSQFLILENRFGLNGKAALITGVLPFGASLRTVNATRWTSAERAVTSGIGTNAPVLLAAFPFHPLKNSHPDGAMAQFIALEFLAPQKTKDEVWHELSRIFQIRSESSLPGVLREAALLSQRWAKERALARELSERFWIETPDSFLDAAAGALVFAADGVWDEAQGAFMHGAVAWRSRLLGWRGMYSGDALGWHDRTRRHLRGFAAQQNTNPIPATIPEPEPTANLSRNENALHSNGNLTKNHYDMNLVAVDALFRHLLWTGDLDFAREVWPMLERHFAWERRLFRRSFGQDRLPLYEAYACIWASDDLGYNGGGVTHASAYNLFHHRMAGRVAPLLGSNPKPYLDEATLIAKSMDRDLWLADRGWFAEWKDTLGLGLRHPNHGAWTFYHTVDSRVPDALQAWQMSRFVETQLPRFPLRGENVPAGSFNLGTTSWMPYRWSLNNVVMAESAQTAHALWQCGREDLAFGLLKGAVLDSMFLGLCPGNVGMCTWLDAHRRESQRDFADGVGAVSRALVEGLFGISPDALENRITLRPGFPAHWDHARLRHPDLDFAFHRKGKTDTFEVTQRRMRPMRLELVVRAFGSRPSVKVNGANASWTSTVGVGAPLVRVEAPAAQRNVVEIEYGGEPVPTAPKEVSFAQGASVRLNAGAKVIEIHDPQNVLTNSRAESEFITGQVIGLTGHRSFFAKIEQGDLTWWQPLHLEVRPASVIVPAGDQDAEHLRFKIDSVAEVSSGFRVSAGGKDVVTKTESSGSAGASPARHAVSVAVPVVGLELLPGTTIVVAETSTGAVQGKVLNWHLKAPRDTRFEEVNLGPHFNDSITRIYSKDSPPLRQDDWYLAPRSPYGSLAIPKQGIGSWCHPTETFEVDDAGLRSRARDGRFTLPQGIPFATPSATGAPNVVFVSQWTNYPTSTEISLRGKGRHIYLLMAGSSHPMQSRFENGRVAVTYNDGSRMDLALTNPENWWPIDQDYFIDDFAFRRPEPIPLRVDLKSGRVRVLDHSAFKGSGRQVPGGAATVLDLPLDSRKELKGLTLSATANEVVIGLMAATLVRP